ncbi:MAG TPA: hypothetical protein VF593_13790 [Chthoniobacteraceae bacterium]|jgi:hypothetical protein
MAERPRSIVHEHEFERELRALVEGAEAADEFVAAAKFLLSYDPEIGSRTDDVAVWCLPMNVISGAEVWLFYSFDEETVWLRAIHAF